MANYLEFTPNVTWAKVRVGYEESYDSATKVNTLTITSIEVMSTKYKADYYVDGTLKVNDTAVFTSKSSSGNVSVSVRVSTSDEPVWYTIKKNGEPVTATIQIEGSETATIELTGNNFQRFAFYTSDGEDGNGWGVNQSQTIDLTGEEEPEEPVVAWDKRSFWLGVSLGLAGKGLPPIKTAEPIGYLYGHVAKEGETPTHTINGVDYVGAVLPECALPKWSNEIYPYLYIGYKADYPDYLPNKETIIACAYQSPRKFVEKSYGLIVENNNNPQEKCFVKDLTTWIEDTEDWIYDYYPFYSNTNIYKEDGTIYLAASDPIPIYE